MRNLGMALALALVMATVPFSLAACAENTASPETTQSPSAAPSLLPTASGQVLNLKRYGGTGNGTSDDSQAVQRALAAAAATGSTVYLPAGVYLCRTPI